KKDKRKRDLVVESRAVGGKHASGNKVLDDIGLGLSQKIKVKHFKDEKTIKRSSKGPGPIVDGDDLVIGNTACDKKMIDKCTCDFRSRTRMVVTRASMFLEECTYVREACMDYSCLFLAAQTQPHKELKPPSPPPLDSTRSATNGVGFWLDPPSLDPRLVVLFFDAFQLETPPQKTPIATGGGEEQEEAEDEECCGVSSEVVW
nr:phosphofructokinase 3 [Tanacetum cinerariifolium]